MASGSASVPITLTPKERELLREVGRYIKTSDVDWKTVATKLGYPKPKSARDKWYPIRDKLFGTAEDGSTPQKNDTPKKRKAADEDFAATPAKKMGKMKQGKGKKHDTPVDEDDDEVGNDGEVKDEPEEEFF